MTTTLITKTGRTTGSPESRRIRNAENIPAVIYGHGMTPILFTVGRRDLRIALRLTDHPEGLIESGTDMAIRIDSVNDADLVARLVAEKLGPAPAETARTIEMLRVEAEGRLKWRLSRASVVENGDFSLFSGIERNLTVLTGPGFDLVGDGLRNAVKKRRDS